MATFQLKSESVAVRAHIEYRDKTGQLDVFRLDGLTLFDRKGGVAAQGWRKRMVDLIVAEGLATSPKTFVNDFLQDIVWGSMDISKTPALVIQPLRDLARGMPCMYGVKGICSGDPNRVVWCHSDAYEDNKAKGRKADDDLGGFGCFECHNYTMSKDCDADEKRELQRTANRRTMRFLWDNKIFRVDQAAAKKVRHFE